MSPPMTPKLIQGSPSRGTKPGMMVWKGRLSGATRFGWPSSRVKPAPRFWSAKPVPGMTTPEPKYS